MRQVFIFLFVLYFFPFQAFAQLNSDGSFSIPANSLYFDPDGVQLTRDQFRDSIATQKFYFTFDFKNDPPKIILASKMPRGIVGKQLPAIEWKTINGDRINYGASGKVTLLSFWSVICKPCVEEFNELNLWATTHSDVQIIAVTADSDSVVSAFMEKNNYSWSNITILPEYKGDFDDIFRVHVWPLNVVTDHRRVIRKVFSGKKEELPDYLRDLSTLSIINQ